MRLSPNDIVSYEGTDYLVEAVITYRVGGHRLVLGRIAAGKRVRWMEPLEDDLDDRALFLDEVRDLDVSTPPPANIYYRGGTYVLVISGTARAVVDGQAPGRASGTCELWRYRAAGDLYLQLEKWPAGVVAMAGASAHRSVLEVRPGK